MTTQEIQEFVQGELSYLELSTEQQQKYINFIKDFDYYLKKNGKIEISAENVLLQRLEECIEFFKVQGFDEKTITELAKNVVTATKRKDWKVRFAFLRMINFEEKVITSNRQSQRFNLEKSHARKMHLVAINDRKSQNINTIINDTRGNFEKRFGIKIAELTNRYPISQETKDVWMFVTYMNDKQLKEYFGMTREELSYIYPTTKEEIAVIHKITTLSDKEILETYGITREELLQKHPLNNDTLKAIKSIHKSNIKAVEKTFDMPKEEVLHLRTITTEMIKAAANKKGIQIKKPTYSKDELREKLMKKGTYPNG